MSERPDTRARRLKPNLSGNDNNCVSWLPLDDGRVEIGNTERPEGPFMAVTEPEFRQLEQDVTLNQHLGRVQWQVLSDGSAEVSYPGQPPQRYTETEWRMFHESLVAGLPGIPVPA